MAKVKFFKINNSELSSLPIVEGQLIFVQDEGKVYIDKDDSNRVLIDGSDLTGYVKNTDYASSSIGGVIKTASSKATSVSSGVLQADTKTYSDYTSGGNNMFIGKGTLENVLTGKGYTTNTGTITGVSVNGTSVATSGVANITSVPASILSGAIPSGVTATTQIQGDSSTKIATTAYVDTAISNLPEPMIFKGSLGTGGTITTLPSASSSNEGWTYKVITDGTYASQAAKVGDTFISDGTAWVLIPSGDEPSGTVTSVKIKATSPIAVDSDSAITTSGTRTISHANSGVTAGTYRSVTVNATGHVTTGSNPTTISGYGITDASISDQTVTLGSNSVTVPTKTSELTNDANFMSGMTILAYGKSTWNDFITAYTAKHIVYTRASSGSNPASGSQTRLAFMAYVNNETSPTEVEFQYYRSMSSHSATQQGDQTYVYKLNKTNGWSVTVRENYTKVAGSDGITGTWSSGTMTLKHDASGVTAGTYNSVTVDAKGHVTAGSNPTTLSGYGITDAKIENGTITLGSNTITPLTSTSTLDATKLSGTIPSGCYTDTNNAVTQTATTTSSAYEILFSGTADNTTRTEGARKTSTLTYNPSTKAFVTGGTINGYTLAAASAKAVDTSISAASTSTNLPTSQAVASFVESKGYVTTEVLSDGVFYLANVSGTAAVTATSPYTAALWTATGESRITSLYSGLTVTLNVPVAGNSSYGTLLDINGLGYHPICVNVNDHIGTRYPVGSTVVMVYNATQTRTAYYNSSSAITYTGVWQIMEYDSTNIWQLRDDRTYCYVDPNAGTLYRYEICLTNKDNKIIPYNNVSNAGTTYTKVLTSQPFDPFGTIYWYSHTDTVNAGASVSGGRLYYHWQSDIRYSFNIYASGVEGTTSLTLYKPIYIKALYNKSTHTATLVQDVNSSSYLERSSIVQDLPTSNPNSGLEEGTCYIYIYFGRAYSKYQAELSMDHPVYTWDEANGAIANILDLDDNISLPLSSANQTYYLAGTKATSAGSSQLYNTRMSNTFTGVKYQTSTSTAGGTLTVDERPVTLGLYYDIS